MKKSLFGLLIVSLVLTLAAGTAFAGAFRIPESSATAMGQGNAFAGQADDASAIQYNVGGLSQVEGSQILLGGTLVSLGTDFTAENAPFAGVKSSMEDKVHFPPYLFYANHIGESNWWIGLGINSPFGLSTEWNNSASFNQAGLGAAGTPLVTETMLSIIKVAPVVTYKFSDSFSLGFGPEYYNAFDVKYAGGSPFAAPDPNGNLNLEGDGDGWGATLGGLFTINEKWQVGLAWHSGVTLALEGDGTGIPTGNIPPPLGGTDPPPYSYDGKAKLDLNIPDTFVLGANFKATDKWSFNLDLDWTQWSDYKNLQFQQDDGSNLANVIKNYDDSLAVRAGASYYLNERWTLRGGLLHEKTPVPEETYDPRLPDADSTGVTLGFGYDTGKFALNAAYMALFKGSRDVTSGEGNGLYDGKYETFGNLLGVDVTFRF
jgi:long-chain fatty acid transport protein